MIKSRLSELYAKRKVFEEYGATVPLSLSTEIVETEQQAKTNNNRRNRKKQSQNQFIQKLRKSRKWFVDGFFGTMLWILSIVVVSLLCICLACAFVLFIGWLFYKLIQIGIYILMFFAFLGAALKAGGET